jgi:hypothetical protein
VPCNYCDGTGVVCGLCDETQEECQCGDDYSPTTCPKCGGNGETP